ncbi:MAG: Hsp70 family protein [Clostridia bacterium]|nr:Hsp70 family protein [Clostridia bacterium]
MAKNVYGIDLGTTYSCIAYVDETEHVTVIKNEDGHNITPSVVYFENAEKVVVGEAAKDCAYIEPANTIMFVKSLMGKTDYVKTCYGRDLSPEEVSSFILRKLAMDATKALDCEVKDVVITCPAYFGTAEREATRNAGIIAGLNVMDVINEPTAAAIYYGVNKEHAKKTILIYDLGGGTFDVTVMKIDDEVIDIICCDGNHSLGGKDWDERVMSDLEARFRDQTGTEDEFDEENMQALRSAAEKAKKNLSARDVVKVALNIMGLRGQVVYSREDFETSTAELLNTTVDITRNAIETAERILADRGEELKLDEILLVGGSTRMPQVTRSIIENFGIEPKTLDPDEAVAKGAAMYAMILAADLQAKEEQRREEEGERPMEEEEKVDADRIERLVGTRKKIIYSTTKSYAVRALVNNEPKCCNLIIKNHSLGDDLEISASREFGTAEDNMDNVDIAVYENDYMDEYFEVDDNLLLGNVSLTLPGNLPEGSPIEVLFTLKSNGLLKVYGKDTTTGNDVSAELTSQGIMTQEEVEEIKKKSQDITVI